MVKAQLQQQQRERDLSDATLQAQRSRLELGVLLYADPRGDFSLEAPLTPPVLASRADIEAAATHLNPELRSAFESLHVNDLDVSARPARPTFQTLS